MCNFLKKYWRKILIYLIIFGLVFTFTPIFWLYHTTKDKIYSIEDAPKKPVAIVFGAAVVGTTRPSGVAAGRVEGAVELYNQEKVDKLLISGDNSRENYNEPVVMKNYAMELGVPEEDIVVDYAGFRTYDTCARAKEIFGVDSAILVSQEFHLARCIFLCESFGIDSVGVIADNRKYSIWTRQKLREIAGHIISFYEVYLFPHDPHFLGEQEADLT